MDLCWIYFRLKKKTNKNKYIQRDSKILKQLFFFFLLYPFSTKINTNERMKVSARTAIASRVKSLRKSKADRAEKAWPKTQKSPKRILRRRRERKKKQHQQQQQRSDADSDCNVDSGGRHELGASCSFFYFISSFFAAELGSHGRWLFVWVYWYWC